MIRKFGIKVADTDSPITSLSGGNQQKVVLARALAKKPLVLLLDEPTRGVDVGAREEIYELLGRLADEGLAVLLASSDLVELINVCDRIVVMHESEIVGEIAGSSATEEEIALLSAGGSPSDYVA
jgi:ABC-type sugar transport system ATPase subunit